MELWEHWHEPIEVLAFRHWYPQMLLGYLRFEDVCSRHTEILALLKLLQGVASSLPHVALWSLGQTSAIRRLIQGVLQRGLVMGFELTLQWAKRRANEQRKGSLLQRSPQLPLATFSRSARAFKMRILERLCRLCRMRCPQVGFGAYNKAELVLNSPGASSLKRKSNEQRAQLYWKKNGQPNHH